MAAPPSPAIPMTAMPAMIAPPEPESEGGSARGVVRREYVGSGVGGAAAMSGDAVVSVGVAEGSGGGNAEVRGLVGDALAAVAVAEAPALAGAAVGVDAGCAEPLAVGAGDLVGSGEREGLGDGFGDVVGVGVGSAMTSAQPRAG